jgi:hypothetical protein
VPVAEGKHEVKITRGDTVRSAEVMVRDGRRVRVTLDSGSNAQSKP